MDDEIVCETPEKFERVIRAAFAWTPSEAPRPGDKVTFRSTTIVYRPDEPKPAPPIGCMRDEHIDALKRDGRFVLNGETILYEAKPRDEAREAYLEWLASGIGVGAYAAFLAGRASVKGA